VLETLWDQGGQNHPMITSMREHKGHLYLGGIFNNRIGRLRLEGADTAGPAIASYWRRP
jgi:ribose transport system permease protein